MLKSSKLKSKTQLKSKTFLKSSGRIKKSSKKINVKKSKDLDWSEVRESCIEYLHGLDINTCELKLDNFCTNNAFLTLAHSLKRRFIKTDADFKEVILACQYCHNIIEYDKNMTDIVREVIKKRNNYGD